MKNLSRKYIDLIYAQSSKWANWNPPNKIWVGDYGIINRQTGEFEKEGNIYEDPDIATLAGKYPPREGISEATLMIHSDSVQRLESQSLHEPMNNSAVGLTKASLSFQGQFGSQRGALLLMYQPRSSYIPEKVFLEQLIDIPALKDKRLVTEVVSCPAYFQYLSTAKQEVIKVNLLGSFDSFPPPEAAARGEEWATWQVLGGTGFSQSGCDHNGSSSYTPLYNLKQIRKPRILFR